MKVDKMHQDRMAEIRISMRDMDVLQEWHKDFSKGEEKPHSNSKS